MPAKGVCVTVNPGAHVANLLQDGLDPKFTIPAGSMGITNGSWVSCSMRLTSDTRVTKNFAGLVAGH